MRNTKKQPGIKYERVTDVKTREVTLPNGEKVLEESFAEKEIDATNLVKIAPLYYFCPDNNKVYMIPFSIQFSITEFLQQCAQSATKLEKFLETIPQKEEPSNEQK